MKPENSLNNNSVEQLSVEYKPSTEVVPRLDNIELNTDSNAENLQRQAEASSVISELKLTTAIPAPIVNPDATQNASAIGGFSPATAQDDDLIEKEWVDKAKKIVAETQNDPHQREKKVSQLQVDYIKKRFGRELGVAE